MEIKMDKIKSNYRRQVIWADIVNDSVREKLTSLMSISIDLFNGYYDDLVTIGYIR